MRQGDTLGVGNRWAGKRQEETKTVNRHRWVVRGGVETAGENTSRLNWIPKDRRKHRTRTASAIRHRHVKGLSTRRDTRGRTCLQTLARCFLSCRGCLDNASGCIITITRKEWSYLQLRLTWENWCNIFRHVVKDAGSLKCLLSNMTSDSPWGPWPPARRKTDICGDISAVRLWARDFVTYASVIS